MVRRIQLQHALMSEVGPPRGTERLERLAPDGAGVRRVERHRDAQFIMAVRIVRVAVDCSLRQCDRLGDVVLGTCRPGAPADRRTHPTVRTSIRRGSCRSGRRLAGTAVAARRRRSRRGAGQGRRPRRNQVSEGGDRRDVVQVVDMIEAGGQLRVRFGGATLAPGNGGRPAPTPLRAPPEPSPCGAASPPMIRDGPPTARTTRPGIDL